MRKSSREGKTWTVSSTKKHEGYEARNNHTHRPSAVFRCLSDLPLCVFSCSFVDYVLFVCSEELSRPLLTRHSPAAEPDPEPVPRSA